MISKDNAHVTAIVTKKTKVRLLEQAKKEDVTVSKVIKRAIDAYFKQQAE